MDIGLQYLRIVFYVLIELPVSFTRKINRIGKFLSRQIELEN